MLLWAEHDKEQNGWEQSIHCCRNTDAKLSSKGGQISAGLHLPLTFSFIYSLRINLSETKFSDNQATKANYCFSAGRIYPLNNEALDPLPDSNLCSAAQDNRAHTLA